MSKKSQMFLDLQSDLLHRLHLLLQTFLLSIITFSLASILLIVLLLLGLLVPAPGDCEEDHVTDERKQEAEGDHPGLEEPHPEQEPNEGSRTL